MARQLTEVQQRADEARLSDPARLPTVLRFGSPSRFWNEFSRFETHFSKLKLHEYPPHFRMYQVLMLLDVNENVEDIGGFFVDMQDPVGAYAHEAYAFLKSIGARKAAAYLGDAIKLFPNAKVPKNGTHRSAQHDRIWHRQLNGRNPFALLKRKHRGALRSMYAPYQSWAREHETELLAELGAAGRRVDATRTMKALDRMLALKTPLARVKRGAPKEHVALYAIWERISERMSGANPEQNLTHGERLLHTVFFVMDAEIDNGGIHQFFSNSAGDFGEEARGYLKEIGAKKTEAALARAARVFPGGRIPTDRDRRNRVLDALEKRSGERVWTQFDDLSSRYYSARREMYPLLLSYIRKNKDQFANPE